MTNKTALLVSLNFPPSQIASVHRARHLAKHLPAFGWRPVVIAVDERFHKEPVDPSLGRLVSPDVAIHRVKALPLWMTSCFGVGDLAIRSIFHVSRKIDQLVSETKPGIVFFTGWPFYQMLLAGRVKKRFGLPVILDFQDPWVSTYGATRPRWSKDGISHRLAMTLEPRAVRNAAYITSVSDTQNDEMATRYPWIDRKHMAAIPIGGDMSDFDGLRMLPPESARVALDSARINLSYVGTFLPLAEPLARLLLRSLARLRKSEPELAARVRLNFIGTSNQPNGHNSFRIVPIAVEEGVSDLVCEIPQRLPFLEALSLLVNSQGILLIGSIEPHYTASKIYSALMSGQPYLSLFHKQSSAHTILSAAGGGLAFSFASLEELAALETSVADGLRQLATQKFSKADPAVFEGYSARAVTGRFAAIFDFLSQNGQRTGNGRPEDNTFRDNC
jgi:Glycosyl transferase 4-like domain